jgi:hypothetical protein
MALATAPLLVERQLAALFRGHNDCIGYYMNDAMSALKARRDEISRAMAKLKVEDLELATAQAVLERFGADASVERGERTPPWTLDVPRVKGAPRSQRSLVIELLSACEPPWVRSGDIVEQVKQSFGADIPERSLRPLLSVLKRERVIVRSGRHVALTERLDSLRVSEKHI